MVGADPTKGLGFMSTYDGLFIQQKMEVFEVRRRTASFLTLA